MSQPNPQRLKTPEAAAYAGCSYSLLTKLRCTGGGPRFSKIGRPGTPGVVVYDTADIDAWLEANKHHSTSEYQTVGAAA